MIDDACGMKRAAERRIAGIFAKLVRRTL